MNIKTQRMVDRYAGRALCFLMTLFYRISRKIFRDKTNLYPRRILVILLSEMGSLVLADPMFDRLEETYPKQRSICCSLKRINPCLYC